MIETNALDFRFGAHQVLTDLSIQVPTGAIYGFLGPNGAGKSTTIRALMGLYKTPRGSITLFGRDLRSEREAVLQRIGALVESPSLYEHLSGRDNLEITRRMRGLRKELVTEMLKVVGLERDAPRKAGTYSTGMRQRLGLAQALLAEPDLLVLDEPANGLDPQGMRELRELLLGLNRERGITIFISSHILSEIEKTATHVGIIDRGRLLFQGSLGELKDISLSSVRIETRDAAAVSAILGKEGFTARSLGGDALALTVKNRDEITGAIRVMIEHEQPVYEVNSSQKSLEDLFLNMTDMGGAA
ncbi:MAG: ATP-binding cassette domain-containing protein [bacterium]|nr:ATP-binding cassette domain-containing protein [bacterium]